MRTLLATALALVACALVPSAGAAEPVHGGVVDPFRGIAGVQIGMREAVVRRVLGRPDFRNAQDVYSYGDLTIDFERGRVGEIYSTGVRFCTVGGLCVGEPGARAKLRREGVRAALLTGSVSGPFLHACRRVRGRAISFEAPVELGRRLRANQFLVRDSGRRCPTRDELVEPPA
jgi:hypothetical protein